MSFSSFPFANLAEAVGGIGLFILGMRTMSDGLQHLAGNRFRSVLERITRNRFSAAFLGASLASILQSGGSASIVIISFINAGLISIYQALAILLGTGVGATVVVQMIAFQVTNFALFSIFIGVCSRLFLKRRYLVHAGDLLLGTGLLFLGLRIMESGLVPVAQSAIIKSITEYVFAWKISSVLLGTILTFIAHSPSAAMGIVIAFATGGIVSFTDALGMVLGSNLGIAFLTILAAIGGTAAARRVAGLNLLINFLAVLLALLMFPLLVKGVQLVTAGGTDVASLMTTSSSLSPDRSLLPRLIANAHTLFCLFTLFLFLPLVGFITRSADAVRAWSGVRPDLSPRPKFLDSRIINTPTIAMLQIHNEIVRMSEIACSMYDDAVQLLYRFDVKKVRSVQEKEDVLDSLQKQISSFLVQLSRRSSDADSSLRIPVLLHIVNDIERIGDVNWQITAIIQRKKYEKIDFSMQAMVDLKRLAAMVGEVVTLTSTGDRFTAEVQNRMNELHTGILQQQESIITGHVTRMKAGQCSVEAGLLFNDLIAAFVKLSVLSGFIVKTARELE